MGLNDINVRKTQPAFWQYLPFVIFTESAPNCVEEWKDLSRDLQVQSALKELGIKFTAGLAGGTGIIATIGSGYAHFRWCVAVLRTGCVCGGCTYRTIPQCSFTFGSCLLHAWMESASKRIWRTTADSVQRRFSNHNRALHSVTHYETCHALINRPATHKVHQPPKGHCPYG